MEDKETSDKIIIALFAHKSDLYLNEKVDEFMLKIMEYKFF